MLWFNKTLAAVLQSCFALVGFFASACDLQTLPQPLHSCQEAPYRSRRGAAGGGLYPFIHVVVARHESGGHSQSCSDLMEKRKWLMRSDSCRGDVGLPRSKKRSMLPCGWPSSIPLPYVLPDLHPCFWLRRSPWGASSTCFFRLFPKGREDEVKTRDAS